MSEVSVYKLFALSTVSNNTVQWRGSGSTVSYDMRTNNVYGSINTSSVQDEGTGYVSSFFTYPFTSLDFIVTGMAGPAGSNAITNAVAGASVVAAYPATNDRLAHSTNYMTVHVARARDLDVDSAYLLLSFHGGRV
jgi:hypothetical protein